MYGWLRNTQTYSYSGKKNKTKFKDFVRLCKMSQGALKSYCYEELVRLGNATCGITKADGYVYCRGNIPVLVTAHLDTVHKDVVKDFYEEVLSNGTHKISSPQGIGGDDRCGIYMILELCKKGYKPFILFCEDEEIGGIGSMKFCKSSLIEDLQNNINFIIELDRAGSDDAVYYSCDNKDFEEFIKETIGYKYAIGSFSDSENLMPVIGVAGVNLSCGYYNAHKLNEYVIVEEMNHTINAVENLLCAESKQYAYIRKVYPSYYGCGYGLYGYGDWFDDDAEEQAYRKFFNSEKAADKVAKKTVYGALFVSYMENENVKEDWIYADSEEQAWYQFFMEHTHICFDNVIDYEFC